MPVCEFCKFLIYENLVEGARSVRTNDPIPKWKYYHPQCFYEYTNRYGKNPSYKSVNNSSCCFT